jgi:hypothetical protein
MWHSTSTNNAFTSCTVKRTNIYMHKLALCWSDIRILPQQLQCGTPLGDPSLSAWVSWGILSALLRFAPPACVPPARAMRLVTPRGPIKNSSAIVLHIVTSHMPFYCTQWCSRTGKLRPKQTDTCPYWYWSWLKITVKLLEVLKFSLVLVFIFYRDKCITDTAN